MLEGYRTIPRDQTLGEGCEKRGVDESLKRGSKEENDR